jgi:hypothetical protein
MKAKPSAERIYGPLLAKTLPNILQQWLATEFPHLGGPKVRELFVTELMRLIETYYVPHQRLQPGQIIWYAVDKTDLPGKGHTMATTRLIPVTLTLVDRQDIEALFNQVSPKIVRRQVVARLHRQAEAQGGVLAISDSSLLLHQSQATIGRDIRLYEQEHHCIIPRRGTLHDLGRSVSHKRIIVKKALQEGKQAPDVAWETDHTLSCTERYLVDLMRVYISIKRHGMTNEAAAFATNLSLSLVKEYAELIVELDLNDDQLPNIMSKLEQMAQLRQQNNTNGTSKNSNNSFNQP